MAQDYETDGSSALAPNDPYKGMSRSDIRPNLKVVEGGAKTSRPNSARESLVNSEKTAAAKSVSTIAGGAGEAKSVEQNQTFSPRFTGKGVPGGEQKTKKKGFWNNKGPLMAIMGLLLGGGGVLVGSQMVMPFATANRVIQEFNSMKTVMGKRSDRVLRYQMDTERYKSPTRKTIFGNDKFKISAKQATKLKMEGIDFMEVDVGGKKVRLLLFDDGSGTKQPILTNTDIDNNRVDGDALVAKLKADMPDVDIASKPIKVDAAFEIDNFKNGYLTSSKTWKGNIAGWFDSLVLKIFDRLGISRNRFQKWKNASDIEAGNAAFKETAENKRFLTEGEDSRITKKDDQDTGKTDGDGKPITEEVDVDVPGNDDKALGGKKTLAEVHSALDSKVRKITQATANVACAVFAAAGAIHGIVAAQQAIEILNLVTGYLESVQKVQAGEGDGSPMIYYTNALTSSESGKKSGMASQGMSSLFGSGSINVNDESVQATNSESLMSKVQLFGQELSYSAQDFKNCAYVKLASGVVDLVVDVIGIATFGIASVIKGLVKSIAVSATVALVVSLFGQFVIPFAAKMIMKNYLTDFVGEDLGNAIVSGANKYLGGNHQGGGGSPGDMQTVLAFQRETRQILAEEAEYDRQTKSPFDVTSQNTFLGSMLYKIMPVASNMTSLTSMVSSFGNLLGSSITSLLPTAGAMADTELVTTQGDCPLLESVGIVGDAYCNPYYTSDLTTINDDPGEVTYETVANMHLAQYQKVYKPLQDDVTLCRHKEADGTFYWSYQYPTNFKYDIDNTDDPEGCVLDTTLDEEDNPVINGNSALGRYIVFCGQRTSAWGIADASIASQAAKLKVDTGIGMLDGALEGAMGAIPLLGGIWDAAQAAEDLENVIWVGGSACVARSEASDTGGDTAAEEAKEMWTGETKYYQRYVEDQRMLEASGIVKKSAVTAMLDEYYEANPLDNSYEGILARFSGMSKDDVIATLDLIDRASFIAEYEPSGLAPTVVIVEEVALEDQTPDGIIADPADMPVAQHIIYTDVRNRTYAI